MLVRNRIVVLVVAFAALGASAAVAPASTLRADATARGEMDSHLRSLGLDPAIAVVQDSLLNYAGPDCPGAGWSCVAATRPVVQISEGGINIFEAAGGSSHEHSCSVTQSNTTGPNTASCSLNTNENGVTQTAWIQQTNGSGNNNAAVNLNASIAGSQTGSEATFDQMVGQEAAVFQTSGSGRNNATIDEILTMTAEGLSVDGGSSLQDSRAVAVLEQDSGSGQQIARIVQDHRLTSRFTGPSGEVEVTAIGDVAQEQQTRATDRNIVAFANQQSNSGVNDLDLAQNQVMRMIADDIAGQVSEEQGNDAGGMIGDIQQDSVNGTGHYDADIFKEMIADPDADIVIQAEDPNCCDILGLSPGTPTTCTIDMLVRILGPDHAQQDSFLRGRAFAESNCDVVLHLIQFAGKDKIDITETRSGTFVDLTVDCDGAECTTGDSPPDPSSPSGNLHLSVRNKSDGEEFSKSDPQKPYFTDGVIGQVFDLKLEFHNHTSGPLNNVVLRIPLPPGMTFASCNACVGGAPQDGVLIFERGTIAAGKKAVGIFRVRPSLPGFFSTLGSFTSSSGGADSNPVWYLLG